MSDRQRFCEWSRVILRLAGIYNLVWGAIVIAAPSPCFAGSGWKNRGILPFGSASAWWSVSMELDTGLRRLTRFRHWPIVLVGLIGKVLGPIGFVWAAWTEQLPWAWGLICLTNDLIWWVPFGLIMSHVFRIENDRSDDVPAYGYGEAIHDAVSHRGETLGNLSKRAPTLVVFLRYTGCIFAQETLARLSRLYPDLERRGIQLAIVHMGSWMDGRRALTRYGLEGAHHFSDVHCRLYRAFGLPRGTFMQMLSPAIICRGLDVVRRGHAPGVFNETCSGWRACFSCVTRSCCGRSVLSRRLTHPTMPTLCGRTNGRIASRRDRKAGPEIFDAD